MKKNSQPIISLKNVGKKYVIGTQEPYVSLRDSLSQAFSPKKRARKKEFWAVEDVSFDVAPGESFGIIGRNGAGKSTLLKILSQITPPTTGKISIAGRVASLLEVGTGFHPELTGRENIFLNGAILGMSQKEIKRKFDEIVDFSGIEKFLDTPVKRYSSGMYVRLAFAVAAHLEPEILIVDEVLAVGDAEFQKKCLGKMEQVTKEDGRTILFVSHNLLTVQSLCKKTVLLEHGHVKKIGKTDDVINLYLNERPSAKSGSATTIQLHDRLNAGEIRFSGLSITNEAGQPSIQSHDKLKFTLNYTSDMEQKIRDVRVVITVTNERTEQTVLRLDSAVTGQTLGETLPAEGKIVCETDAIHLNEGNYWVDIDFLIQGTSVDLVKRAAKIEVSTSLAKYGFKIPPDISVSDRAIRYSFKAQK